MFEHSIRVPRQYKEAAKAVELISRKGASVKDIIYQINDRKIKRIYALVVETLKHSRQLEFLFKRTKILEKEPALNPWIARVLITQLLWRKKNLDGDSRPVKIVLAYQQVLNAHVSDLHENEPTEKKVTKPRFVRVNTLRISVKDAIDGFRDEGWTFIRYLDTKNYDDFLKKVANLSTNEFMVDLHIPEVLIFPPNTQFFSHRAYKQGLIILQDKASCLPVHILNPPPGSAVLDMCAAPGMKTSHLAAKLNNNGKVYAVDINTERLETLETLMERNGVTCVETIYSDAIQVTDSKCPQVKYILVDPSCSGSGIVDRLDFNGPTTKDPERIEKLRKFQIMILKHALRRFPNAQRVIYSTCSLYPEENEEVVEEVIKQINRFKLLNASELMKTPWHNFGSEKYGNIGKSCLYAKPEKDLTNGFFVAIFERLEDGEQNEYYVENVNFRNMKMLTNDRNENINNNINANQVYEEEVTENNNYENLDKKSKRKKKSASKISNYNNENQFFQSDVAMEKLSSTEVETDQQKEKVGLKQSKKKIRPTEENLNCNVEKYIENIEDTEDHISTKKKKKKKKTKRRLENDENENMKNIVVDNHALMKEEDVIVEVTCEESKQKKHHKKKYRIDECNGDQDKHLIATAIEESNQTIEDVENHISNETNKKKKKKKKSKHHLENADDHISAKTATDNISTETSDDHHVLTKTDTEAHISTEINKKKAKKRKHSDNNTDDSTNNMVLNSDLIVKNKDIDVSITDEERKHKKHLKKESRLNDTSQDEKYLLATASDIESLNQKEETDTNSEVNLEKKKKKKHANKDHPDTIREVSSRMPMVYEPSKIIEIKIIEYKNKKYDLNKSSNDVLRMDERKHSREDENINENFLTAVNELNTSVFKSMAENEELSMRKKKKKDKKKNDTDETCNDQNQAMRDESLLGVMDVDIDGNELSQNKKKHKQKNLEEDQNIEKINVALTNGDTLELGSVKKVKKRRQSAVMDDSFQLENLFGAM